MKFTSVQVLWNLSHVRKSLKSQGCKNNHAYENATFYYIKEHILTMMWY